jgi:hypothetical protein
MSALEAILRALAPGEKLSAQDIEARLGRRYSRDEIELAAHAIDGRNDVFVLRETAGGPYTFSEIYKPALSS